MRSARLAGALATAKLALFVVGNALGWVRRG